MNAVNYQKLYERTVSALGERRPKLLLHVCCGPCAAACLEELSARFDVTIFFYNPNIAPAAEYDRRLENARRLVEAMPLSHPVRFLAGEYRPEDFLSQGKSSPFTGQTVYGKCLLTLSGGTIAWQAKGGDQG